MGRGSRINVINVSSTHSTCNIAAQYRKSPLLSRNKHVLPDAASRCGRPLHRPRDISETESRNARTVNRGCRRRGDGAIAKTRRAL